MMVAFLNLAVASLLGADIDLDSGRELHFRGTVAQVERGSAVGDAQKSFELTLLVTRADDAGTDYVWLLDERGNGGFGWTDRFGRWGQNAAGATVGAAGPALLFDYGTGKHVVPLLAPQVVLPPTVEAGAKWEHDDLEHELIKQTTVDDRKVWEVEVRNQFGHQRKAWVDADSGLAVRYEARVFMNQGTEYRLSVELVDAGRRGFDAMNSLTDGVAALEKLRSALKRPPRMIDAELKPEQVAKLSELLPTAQRAAAEPALARIVTAAERDLERQAGRTSQIEQVAAKQVGRKVEPFQVRGDGDLTLSDADLNGAITVLHFWDYRDAPLTEPYGQVGYLEFLFDRRKAAGLKVIGVAVDGRFQNPETAGQAASGVRRLKNFMNLTYPVVFDDGALVKQFGDPRSAGAALPLFVVIGRDGTVVHYHVGHYEVDRETGLKKLDDLAAELLSDESGSKPRK